MTEDLNIETTENNNPRRIDPHFIANAIGEGLITSSGRNVAISDGNIISQNITSDDRISYPVISEQQAIERLAAAARTHLDLYRKNIEQARNESAQFFKWMLIFSGLGFLVVVFGIFLLYFSQTTAGIMSAISGIIPEVTAYLFSKKDKELRKTIESYQMNIENSQQLLTMVDIAETMKDQTNRDEIKRQIIYKVLGMKP